jgi:hypothetical protein
MGDKQNQPFQLSFNASLKLDYSAASRACQNGQKRAVGTPLISLEPGLVAEFIVFREGKAYDAHARGPDRNSLVDSNF